MSKKKAIPRLTCKHPDRDCPKLMCGHPLPCPWHTAIPYITPEVNTTVHFDGQHWRDKPMEYELIKPISLMTLEEAGACDRELHRFAFVALKKCAPMDINFGTEFSLEFAMKLASQCPGGIALLKEKGFIRENEPEVFYRIGQRFLMDGDEYLLAQVAPNEISLINLEDGNRYSSSHVVCHVKKITYRELMNVCLGCEFTQITE